MTELFSPELISSLVLQLGIGTIFLYLFLDERKKNSTERNAFYDMLHNKDGRIREMTDTLQLAYEENTKALVTLNATVNHTLDEIKELNKKVKK